MCDQCVSKVNIYTTSVVCVASGMWRSVVYGVGGM